MSRNERFSKLLARVLGNALVSFATVFLASSYIKGEGDFEIALATALVFALLASGKELVEYGESSKLKGLANNVTLF